jgi:hypothetical protein
MSDRENLEYGVTFPYRNGAVQKRTSTTNKPFGNVMKLGYFAMTLRNQDCIHEKVKKLRSAFFWGITQRRIVNLYRRFGTAYRFHLQG